MATVTEGHQRNVLKTPSRIPSVPTTLTTTSSRHLLLTVRPGASPSTKSSPLYRTLSKPTSGGNTAPGRSMEPQQPYQSRLLTAVAVAGLASPASAWSAINMPAVDVDSLLHKSSFAKSSQERCGMYTHICVCIYMQVYIYIHFIYIYIYIYIYTLTYSYIYCHETSPTGLLSVKVTGF